MAKFQKVSVGLSGVIHLSRMEGHKTLCGRQWWSNNNHGLTYCKACQSSLSRLKKRALAVVHTNGTWTSGEKLQRTGWRKMDNGSIGEFDWMSDEKSPQEKE